MKLPKFLRPSASSQTPLESSSVTISADTLAVAPYRAGEPSGEHRRVLLTAPAGITAVPATGAEALSAAVGGDTLLLGCLEGAAAKSITLTVGGGSISLAEDSIRIAVGGSSITVTGSGITLRSGGTVFAVTPDGVSQ